MLWTTILGWISGKVEQFFHDLYALIPPVPSFVGSGIDGIHTLAGYAANFSAFVDWPFLGVVLLFMAGMWGLSMTIQIARIVASFLTLGGGGT